MGLRGSIPPEIGNLSFLVSLDLGSNSLYGPLPKDICNLPRSTNNSISGHIPLLPANVKISQLSGNIFSGSVSSICKTRHDQLLFLDISNNRLAGEVPNWEKMPNLHYLNLANNSFFGEIPRSLGSLRDLFVMQLRGNRLSGGFPSSLGHCQGLELFDVVGNELTGEIPNWISQIYNVEFLNLGRNKLVGSIPVEICNLTYSIKVLDLSGNNLFGRIPDCFNNFTSLAQENIPANISHRGYVVYFHYNDHLPNVVMPKYYDAYLLVQWKGQESEYRRNLVMLKLVDFSSNRLSCNIPQSFSSMRGLISLNLSSNSFTGNIIPDIGGMKMLECLDLSANRLSGKIHMSLAQLQYLAVLDLSNNRLHGKIPTSTQLQSFNASAYAMNDGLCGPPMALCPEDSLKPSTTNLRENTYERGNNLSFMQEVGISMAFGFVFGFWGVVGFFILKKSWRIAFFNFFDDVV